MRKFGDHSQSFIGLFREVVAESRGGQAMTQSTKCQYPGCTGTATRIVQYADDSMACYCHDHTEHAVLTEDVRDVSGL